MNIDFAGGGAAPPPGAPLTACYDKPMRFPRRSYTGRMLTWLLYLFA